MSSHARKVLLGLLPLKLVCINYIALSEDVLLVFPFKCNISYCYVLIRSSRNIEIEIEICA